MIMLGHPDLFKHGIYCGQVFVCNQFTQIRFALWFGFPGSNELFDIQCAGLNTAVYEILPGLSLFIRRQLSQGTDLGFIDRHFVPNWRQIVDDFIGFNQAVCLGSAHIPPCPGIRFKRVAQGLFIQTSIPYCFQCTANLAEALLVTGNECLQFT